MTLLSILSTLLGLASALLIVGALLLATPFWWVWRLIRHHRLRGLLRSRGWPSGLPTRDLLIYPDEAFRKVPPWEEVLATPLGEKPPREQLKAVLQMLSGPGAQWMRL